MNAVSTGFGFVLIPVPASLVPRPSFSLLRTCAAVGTKSKKKILIKHGGEKEGLVATACARTKNPQKSGDL